MYMPHHVFHTATTTHFRKGQRNPFCFYPAPIHLPTLAVGASRDGGTRSSGSQSSASFPSAISSILSELDDSASRRHRSVGGFLLRTAAAYMKHILHGEKENIIKRGPHASSSFGMTWKKHSADPNI